MSENKLAVSNNINKYDKWYGGGGNFRDRERIRDRGSLVREVLSGEEIVE